VPWILRKAAIITFVIVGSLPLAVAVRKRIDVVEPIFSVLPPFARILPHLLTPSTSVVAPVAMYMTVSYSHLE